MAAEKKERTYLGRPSNNVSLAIKFVAISTVLRDWFAVSFVSQGVDGYCWHGTYILERSHCGIQLSHFSLMLSALNIHASDNAV